jgi:hypothetical protein
MRSGGPSVPAPLRHHSATAAGLKGAPYAERTMTRVLDDILLFACAAGLIAGIVLAAATLPT